MVICVFGGAVLLWLIVRHSKIFKLNINIELDVLLPHTSVNGIPRILCVFSSGGEEPRKSLSPAGHSSAAFNNASRAHSLIV